MVFIQAKVCLNMSSGFAMLVFQSQALEKVADSKASLSAFLFLHKRNIWSKGRVRNVAYLTGLIRIRQNEIICFI